MKDEKFDLLVHFKRAGDLCLLTLQQLEDAPDNQKMLETLRSASKILLPVLSRDVYSDFSKAVVCSSNAKTQNVRNFRLELGEYLRNSFSKLFRDYVENAPMLSNAEAEYLFKFLDDGQFTVADAQLALDICVKSGFSAPVETFAHLMRVFERYPDCLAHERSAHPGYVYHPARQRTFDRCPICGGVGEPYFCAFSYFMNSFSSPHLPAKLWMRCAQCENLFTWKFPEEFLSLSEGIDLLQPNPEHYVTAVEIPCALSIWSEILAKLQNYTEGDSLLEIGVGKGELMAVALEARYHVEAVEIVPEDAQRIADLLGVPVWRCDFLNFTSDKRYDMIMMGDVIEHIVAPEIALRKAFDLLADGGVLWLSTPNFESSFSRMMKFNDAMWCEPYHITYFSYRGFAALAEKCGFDIQDYSVSSRYNGSMELILTKRNERKP